MNNKMIITILLLSMAVFVPASYAADEHPGVVNINTADADTLQKLPRVGPVISARVVEFRSQVGAFGSKEDLLKVRGIGPKTMEMLRTFVVVEGETTLTRKLKTSDVPASSEETTKVP